MPRTPQQPKYRRHSQSGQAIVTLPDGKGGRKDFLLGPHNSKASKERYDQLIAGWLSRGRRLACEPNEPGGISVNELMVAYLDHVETYYRKPDGTPTSEVRNIKQALRPVRILYGLTPAKDFSFLALEAVRNRMITGGRCRSRINKDVTRIRKMFKWAMPRELVPADVVGKLQALEGLLPGRSPARETAKVEPVSRDVMEATIAHAGPVLADMIELQYHTGMRPGELVIIRSIDVNTSGKTWLYTPEYHKTQHGGHKRIIAIGPQGQAILRRRLKTDLHAYLFSPKESVEHFRRLQRVARKTRVQPSQQCRKKAVRRKGPRDRYDVVSYGQAIARAAQKADRAAHVDNPKVPADERIVPHWHPHQLRHAKATEIEREFGIDASRAVLGHRTAAITETYVKRDVAQAAEIMAKIG